MTVAAVRVGVRVRPLTNQEIQQAGKSVIQSHGSEIQLGERRFTYDAVFDSQVTQSELYTSVSKPLLFSFLDGYNATVSFLLIVDSYSFSRFLTEISATDHGVWSDRIGENLHHGK